MVKNLLTIFVLLNQLKFITMDLKLNDLPQYLQVKAFNYCKNQHGIERAEFCKEINPKVCGMFKFDETNEGWEFWETVTESDNKKVLLVVVDEHTLGYIQPELPNDCQILQASILKGATHTWENGPISLFEKQIRLASKEDFETFRVSFKGYDNTKEYVYNR